MEDEMVQIGAIIMCNRCRTTKFKTDDPVRLEKDTYQIYLEKYRESI
jgi:hypothetical protein